MHCFWLYVVSWSCAARGSTWLWKSTIRWSCWWEWSRIRQRTCWRGKYAWLLEGCWWIRRSSCILSVILFSSICYYGVMSALLWAHLSLMLSQFNPEMDACIRAGNWLNLSTLWDTELSWKPSTCFPEIKKGSYFPGSGLVLFNTSGGCIMLLSLFIQHLSCISNTAQSD